MPRRLNTRALAAVLAGLLVAVALASNDLARDRWWAVTAAQIADARASGRPGLEVTPGRFVTEPLAAEDVGTLPLRWALGGLAAWLVVFAVAGRRRAGRS